MCIFFLKFALATCSAYVYFFTFSYFLKFLLTVRIRFESNPCRCYEKGLIFFVVAEIKFVGDRHDGKHGTECQSDGTVANRPDGYGDVLYDESGNGGQEEIR